MKKLVLLVATLIMVGTSVIEGVSVEAASNKTEQTTKKVKHKKVKSKKLKKIKKLQKEVENARKASTLVSVIASNSEKINTQANFNDQPVKEWKKLETPKQLENKQVDSIIEDYAGVESGKDYIKSSIEYFESTDENGQYLSQAPQDLKETIKDNAKNATKIAKKVANYKSMKEKELKKLTK